MKVKGNAVERKNTRNGKKEKENINPVKQLVGEKCCRDHLRGERGEEIQKEGEHQKTNQNQPN